MDEKRKKCWESGEGGKLKERKDTMRYNDIYNDWRDRETKVDIRSR